MVDDEEIDRLCFTRLVQTARLVHPLRIFPRAENVIDAFIAVLRGEVPPLVCFLDVRMPDMSGFDVLRWMRCQHALDEIPVIMLSSSQETRDVADAQHFGAQGYVAKFPPPEQFRAMIDEAEAIAGAAATARFKVPCNLLSTLPSTAVA